MQAISYNRKGLEEGILLNDRMEIPCGECSIPPHPERDTLHDRGLIHYLHLEGFQWSSDEDLVKHSNDQLVVKFNTRSCGKRTSWVLGKCEHVVKNRPSTPLREDNKWVEGLAVMRPQDRLVIQPEWKEDTECIIWEPDGEGIILDEDVSESIAV